MKIDIVGASHFVNRMFQACGPYQWARELLKNSLEAGATRVEFGIEWQAVSALGVYRRTVADNGCGMNAEDLKRFFSTLGAGAKTIGGIHENFGVGAKIAALPWNPEGVVVISYVAGNASMIWILLNEESGEYELREFQTQDGVNACVIDPTTILWEEVDWSRVRPDWLSDHGTVVVLLGSEASPDTVLGNPESGESDIKGLSVYLNSRFWDLERQEVTVVELRSEKRANWPTGPSDRDDARRPNNRSIKGARFYITDVKAENGRLAHGGSTLLDEGRVPCEWYLWEGERPAIHSYAKKQGFIALRYNDELFHLTTGKVQFRYFGVIESAVQQNLWIILEPQHFQVGGAKWGVHPDQSRNRLIFTGNGEKGVEPPLPDWGLEFADAMPEPVRDAIRVARGEGSGSIQDEEYRRRLQDKFGRRWTVKRLVAVGPAHPQDAGLGNESEDELEVLAEPDPFRPSSKRKRPKTLMVVRKKPAPGEGSRIEERDAPVDVPRFRYARKEEFEREWHAALWAPTDPAGPTVVLNSESPLLAEVLRYHEEQYPQVMAEEVHNIVKQAIGEVAACKVAHAEKLTQLITREELNEKYRNEAALTIALMGLLAEESLIAQRLGRLGRKRPSDLPVNAG